MTQSLGTARTDTLKGAGGQADYVSYLLRLWRGSGKKAVWRASLENVFTGERTGFASRDELFDFVRGQTGAGANARGDKDETSARKEVVL